MWTLASLNMDMSTHMREMSSSKFDIARRPGEPHIIGVMVITHQRRKLYRTQLKRNYYDCWHSSRASDTEKNRIECLYSNNNLFWVYNEWDRSLPDRFRLQMKLCFSKYENSSKHLRSSLSRIGMSSPGIRKLDLGPQCVVRKNWKACKSVQICNKKLQLL